MIMFKMMMGWGSTSNPFRQSGDQAPSKMVDGEKSNSKHIHRHIFFPGIVPSYDPYRTNHLCANTGDRELVVTQELLMTIHDNGSYCAGTDHRVHVRLRAFYVTRTGVIQVIQKRHVYLIVARIVASWSYNLQHARKD